MIGGCRRLFRKVRDFQLKLGDALEIVVDAGKADKCHGVDIAKCDGDATSDFRTGNFMFEVAVNAIVYLVCDLLFDCFGDGSLATCGLDAAKDLHAVEWNARAILLDHLDSGQSFCAFITCESLLAHEALASAADALSAFDGAAVDDARVWNLAVWAVQRWFASGIRACIFGRLASRVKA